ncbi:MAG: ferrous iron transport protein A [Syntrophobacteraceae bacterium]
MIDPAATDTCCPCEEVVEPADGRMALCHAKTGGKVKVACVGGGRRLCGRMAALGIYPGVEMQLLCAGCGFPCLVRVNGGTLSLGEGISDKILVTPSA